MYHNSHGKPHSRRPSAHPPNATAVSPVSPSYSFGPSISSQAMNAASGISQRPAGGNTIDPQSSGRHLSINNTRASGDLTAQTVYASQPVALPGIVPPNLVRMPNPSSSIAQQVSPPIYSSHATAPLPQVPHHLPYSPPAFSQQPLNSPHFPQPPSQCSPQRQNPPGMFHQARNFSATGPFIKIDGPVSVNNIDTSSNQLMEKLLQKTIHGASAHSSARDPPPRCHRGTRSAIIQRCVYFIMSSNGAKRMYWVVGAAGVGKSAIMQNVAEAPLKLISKASVFFSVNGRNEGTQTILTLVYQLAVNYEPYRRFVEQEIARDLSVLESSMSKQFNKFIVEPFIYHPHLRSAGRVLIILDGLDECDNKHIQQELLHLISDFCIMHRSSSLVWLISSRPEPHITSFFSRPEVMEAYEREEILVDSVEARRDIEQFLRYELAEIKRSSDSIDPWSEWPEGRDFDKLVGASVGLFAYADTVAKYIGDRNPASRLDTVLKVIDNHPPMHGFPPEKHPMALLDALYAQILSKVRKNMIVTRKLLLALASSWDQLVYGRGNFLVLCNWLGITPDEAYTAINDLRSVLRVPKRDKAHVEKLESFHKSFIDYISDCSRSRFFRDIKDEARQLDISCTRRIVQEISDAIDFGDVYYESYFGALAGGPRTGDRISLTWRVYQNVDWDNNGTRLMMYKLAMGQVTLGIGRGEETFQNEYSIRLLTTRFKNYSFHFPYDELRDLVLDDSRRNNLMERGILKSIPLKKISFSHIDEPIELHFRCSGIKMRNTPISWNPSCRHQRKGKWDERNGQDWTTEFVMLGCDFCYQQFEDHFKSRKKQFLNDLVTVLFSSTGKCCVEFKFDVRDGDIIRAKWTYRFWCWLPLEERQKYGSTV